MHAWGRVRPMPIAEQVMALDHLHHRQHGGPGRSPPGSRRARLRRLLGGGRCTATPSGQSAAMYLDGRLPGGALRRGGRLRANLRRRLRPEQGSPLAHGGGGVPRRAGSPSPLAPVATSVPVDPDQLRNRVASAFFQDERQRLASLVSTASAKTPPGARAPRPSWETPSRWRCSSSGGVTRFLDAWTARRERIDAPPRRYWAWRLSMRPWEVYLAQLLQFQRQLHDLLTGKGDGGGGNPCAPRRPPSAAPPTSSASSKLARQGGHPAHPGRPRRRRGPGVRLLGAEGVQAATRQAGRGRPDGRQSDPDRRRMLKLPRPGTCRWTPPGRPASISRYAPSWARAWTCATAS